MYKNAPRKNPWRRGRRDARRYRDTHRLQEEQDGAYITPSLIPHPTLLCHTGKQRVEMADTSTCTSRISCTCGTPRSADETQVARGQHGSIQPLHVCSHISRASLSALEKKGKVRGGTMRETTIHMAHTHGDTYMHVVAKPRAPAPPRDKAE
ncbi:hypothetical protein B0H14DRAFT_2636281 [Mycena olivaceomarginata]|nr:hypothetical protein B0H14DRAFT_2636281 [Mycena olivaceomarginata]